MPDFSRHALRAEHHPVVNLIRVPGDTLASVLYTGFGGSESAGQRAAIVMSLVQSAKLNGHDPWAYLRDVLERLPSHPSSRIDKLLPHRWNPDTMLQPSCP